MHTWGEVHWLEAVQGVAPEGTPPSIAPLDDPEEEEPIPLDDPVPLEDEVVPEDEEPLPTQGNPGGVHRHGPMGRQQKTKGGAHVEPLEDPMPLLALEIPLLLLATPLEEPKPLLPMPLLLPTPVEEPIPLLADPTPLVDAPKLLDPPWLLEPPMPLAEECDPLLPPIPLDPEDDARPPSDGLP